MFKEKLAVAAIIRTKSKPAGSLRTLQVAAISAMRRPSARGVGRGLVELELRAAKK
jgi:hypothetical protein